MKEIPKISESELEVLKFLWQFGESTSARIIDHLTQTTSWKPKTIQTLITRLMSKQAITAEKRNARIFIYSAVISEEAYRSAANKTFLQKVYNGSLNLMLANFIKEQRLTKAEIDELKKILDEEE